MGDTAIRKWQIGLQAAFGTPVPATRVMYGTGDLTKEVPPQKADVDSGTYTENYIEPQSGVISAGGSFSMGLFMSQIIEFLKMAVDGSVTSGSAQGSGAYLWTFTGPATSLSYATIEYNDAGDEWELIDAVVNTLTISGSVTGEVTFDVDLVGTDKADTTLTESLDAWQPYFTQGWEAKLYIDALGGTPGTTNISDYLISYGVTINLNRALKYFGNNEQGAGLITRGKTLVTFDIVAELNANAQTEYGHFVDGTARLIRLELGNNKVIGGTNKEFLTIDIPCKLFTTVVGESDNTTTMNFTGENMYGSEEGYDLQIRVQNDRDS